MADQESQVEPDQVTGIFSLSGAARVCLIAVVISLLSSLAVIMRLDSELAGEYVQAIAAIRNAEGLLLPTLVYSNLFQLFVAISAISVAVVFYTRRVAGPLLRLTRVFEEIAAGKIRRDTRIRKGDQLQSMTIAVNDMKGGIRGFVDQVRREREKLLSAIDEFEKAEGAGRAAARARVRDLAESLSRVVARL